MTRILKHNCFFFTLLLLLLSCEDKQECDAVCELQRANFERLTAKVVFRACEGEWIRTPGLPVTDVNIRKTPTGAIASYRPWHSSEFMKAELSVEEWQGLVKSLYKYLNKDFGYENSGNVYKKGERGNFTFTRVFYVSYPSEFFEPNHLVSWQTGPSDWEGVENLMTDIAATVRKRAANPFEDELKAEYQKRFGEPISDFELSVMGVEFWLKGNSCFIIEAFKTETGARAEICNIEVELSTGEWLDFVRALLKSGVGEMENKYGDSSAKKKWTLQIYSSGKLSPNIIEGFGAYPPNWDGLKKVVEDMEAKVIKNSESRKKRKGR